MLQEKTHVAQGAGILRCLRLLPLLARPLVQVGVSFDRLRTRSWVAQPGYAHAPSRAGEAPP